MSACVVCGSSAVSHRVVWDAAAEADDATRTIEVCWAHIAVCATHLEDPCPICDTQ